MEHEMNYPHGTFMRHRDLLSHPVSTRVNEANNSALNVAKVSIARLGFFCVLRLIEERRIYIKLYTYPERVMRYARRVEDFGTVFFSREVQGLSYSDCNILPIHLEEVVSAEAVSAATSMVELERLFLSTLKEHSYVGASQDGSEGAATFSNHNSRCVFYDTWKRVLYGIPERKEPTWMSDNSKKISLTWSSEDLPFSTITSVRWRRIEFHVRTMVKYIRYGSEIRIWLVYDGRLYERGFNNWNWFGEGNGDLLPRISTETHQLRFTIDKNSISIKEQPVGAMKEPEKPEHVLQLIPTPKGIEFHEPWPTEFESRKNEVVLYQSQGNGVDINSYAYIDDGNLVVDYWKLGYTYEDEYYVTVAKKDLHLLYREFSISTTNDVELLAAILSAFKGERSLDSYTEFLRAKQIPFTSSARRG